jgi:hypothetical protein
MRPQDIEKIAQNVAGAFTGSGSTPRAGCGAFSNPEGYSCYEEYNCSAGYECGDLGNFSCAAGDFGCLSGFFCATDYSTELGE